MWRRNITTSSRDLSTFGKSLGNGFSIAVLLGKREINGITSLEITIENDCICVPIPIAQKALPQHTGPGGSGPKSYWVWKNVSIAELSLHCILKEENRERRYKVVRHYPGP
jgi:hypothetical protein